MGGLVGLLREMLGRLSETPAQLFERKASEDRRYFIGLRDRGVITDEQLELELEYNARMHSISWMQFAGEISAQQADALLSQLANQSALEMSLGLLGQGIKPVTALVPPSAR